MTRLKQLYSGMLGARMIEERARILVSRGMIPDDGTFATGHEALAVGALVNLAGEDCVASGRRQFVARFIQGVPMRRIFAEPGAGPAEGHQAASGTCCSVGMVLPRSSFSIQLHQAMGAAWAFKLQRRPQVAVALSAGHSHAMESIDDAVNLSLTYRLPIVHIVATHWDVDSQTRLRSPDAGDGGSGAKYSGLPCFVVDGSDVVAVYRVAQEAIRRARQRHGPAFIECRIPGRDPSSHTAGSVFGDPLAKMEAHLRAKGLWSDKWKAQLVRKFTRELDRAVALAGRTLQPRRSAKDAPAPPSARNANSGHGRTGESSVAENAVVRDTGRLAGSRR